MSPRPAWATLWIPGWPEPHGKMLSKEKGKDEKRQLVTASSSWWNVYWKSIHLPHPIPAAISSLSPIFFTLPPPNHPCEPPANHPWAPAMPTLVLSSSLLRGSHTDSWLLFPLPQSSCFQQTCIIGNDFSYHLCVSGFQFSPMLPPILAPPASAPLTFSLEQASALCLNFPLSLPLQTPAAFVLFWCLRETHAKSPVTLSAGYWLHFKNMMVKLQLRSNWQLCLGGCLQCEWPLALTLVLMHWRASLTVLFRQTPGGF